MTRRAMTLVELLAALAILSAVAAAAAGALREASESSRSSSLRRGAAEALFHCSDLPRAVRALTETEVGADIDRSRLVATSDGRRWRISCTMIEAPEIDEQVTPENRPTTGLDVECADVVVELESAPGAWILAHRIQVPVRSRTPRPRKGSRAATTRAKRARRSQRRRLLGLTLVETLAAISILSLLASVIGVWTSSTLRLQSKIARARPSPGHAALLALRRDLDRAALGAEGPRIAIAESFDALEIVAPPIGGGLGGRADSPPTWRTARWSVDHGRAALVRQELDGSGAEIEAWTVVEGARSFTVEPSDDGTNRTAASEADGPRPFRVTLRWAEMAHDDSVLTWEPTP